MTRLAWTIEDVGTFAACNGLTFVSPRLLEHLVGQAQEPAQRPARRRFLGALISLLDQSA
jgi:hypothetical protein